MKNNTPIICARCGKEFAGGGWDEITYHKCVKPIRTNADRIREMNDDDLSKWMYQNTDYTLEEIKRWLKQEVE